jgi:transcriptional regulator with PAS, ATPase and Fis domain
MEKYTLDTGKRIAGISEQSMRTLMEYNWPGNIRQLENTIEHAVVVADTSQIERKDLPQYLSPKKADGYVKVSCNSLEELERRHILNILKANDWNIRKSAMVLGINRVTLYNKIKKYQLERE